MLTANSRHRSSCIESTIIPLPADFVTYLREDGIILASDSDSASNSDDEDWTPTPHAHHPLPPQDSDSEDDAEPPTPPNRRFPALHAEITNAISSLGGSVLPKLNWSTPKDAAWISPFNTLKCNTANDVYLLLKSSSFTSHDLEHAFDGCAPTSRPPTSTPVLVLRPFVHVQPSLEFRCFVKHRALIGISQRDPNRYEFLRRMEGRLVSRIKRFFASELRFSFPDPSFVFDVYIPDEAGSLGAVRLVDVNPWAPRTDSLLFDWAELLETRVPHPILGSVSEDPEVELSSAGETTEDEDEDEEFEPDMRLIDEGTPAAFNFGSSTYSAHKMPKDVVDAGAAGEGGLAEFAKLWREATGNMGGDMWQQPGASGS